MKGYRAHLIEVSADEVRDLLKKSHAGAVALSIHYNKLRIVSHDCAPLPYDSHSILFHELERKLNLVLSGASSLERIHAGSLFFYEPDTQKFAFLLNYGA